jgi:glutaredoxin
MAQEDQLIFRTGHVSTASGVSPQRKEQMMRWFRSGKKNPTSEAAKADARTDVAETQVHQPAAQTETDIVVYGLENDRRCQALRDLLGEAGFVFRDERIDEDLSTRAWLQRSTGDDALPKLFVGTQCHGTYEDIQALAFRGELKRVLGGEALREDLDRKRLKAEMSVASIIQLLQEEESLIVKEGGAETETWLEPPRTPSLILFEGEPRPIAEMRSIVARIVERHKKGEISLGWRSDQE